MERKWAKLRRVPCGWISKLCCIVLSFIRLLIIGFFSLISRSLCLYSCACITFRSCILHCLSFHTFSYLVSSDSSTHTLLLLQSCCSCCYLRDLLSEFDYWQFWRNTADADVIRFLKLFTEVSLDEINAMAQWEGTYRFLSWCYSDLILFVTFNRNS